MWALPTNFNLLSAQQRGGFIRKAFLGLALLGGFLSVIQAQPVSRLLPQRQPASRPAGPGLPSGNTDSSIFSAAAATVATTTSMDVLDDTRKLGTGDLVSFRVVEDRDPPVGLVVTDSGEMEVPYIGRVKAVGKTCKNLAQSIKSALEVDYYYRATVIIGLDLVSQSSRGRVYVSGEVAIPGSQELPPKEEFTASKALTNAGGFSKFANLRKISILRKSASGNTEKIIFDYKKFQSGQGEDVVLQANDTVNVQPNAVTIFGN